MLVEDQVLFRKALRQLLEEAQAQHEIGEVGTAREALHLLQERPYDLVVTDLCLPDEDGIWLLCKMNEAGLEVPVLVVSATERPELISSARNLGARGSLCKSSEPARFLQAVEDILAGRTHFLNEWAQSSQDAPRLNARTLELLCLSNNGANAEEIRQKMGLSSESLASLTKGVCKKLASESLEMAARKAYSMGLIAGREHG